MNTIKTFWLLILVLFFVGCSKDNSANINSGISERKLTKSNDSLSSADVGTKYVGLFYFSGFGSSLYSSLNTSPTGDAWIMDGQSPAYGPDGSLNFWGKPLWAANHGDGTIKNNYIFYVNNDPSQPNSGLLDYHAELIFNADVDFVVLDFTNGAQDFINGPSYISGTTALLNRWQWRKRNGYPTPQIVFFVKDKQTLSTVKQTFFNNYDSNLFFKYLGKKLVLVAQPNTNIDNSDPNQPAIPNSGLFADYTARHCWGLDTSSSYWQFKVNANTPPGPFYYNGIPEEMSAAVATQASYMTNDGVNPYPGAQGRDNGAYFKKYMKAARDADVKFVFIHSWNEWNTVNAGTQNNPTFIDQWKEEYSSDIEPMEGGHSDQYYQLMKQEIAKFKQ